MKKTVLRVGVAAIASLAIAAATLVGGTAQPAAAITGSEFDPSYIISDAQFYNGNAMSEAEIQAFLDTRIAEAGGCTNSNCLAIKRTDTFTRAADRNVCAQYTGAGQESTARILFKVQQACGISARVLLVTLQKEQSLLSIGAPSNGRIEIAMGYACPDTSACDTRYYGLYNQLYSAAWQFKRYSTPDRWGRYQPGNPNLFIQYNPNPACGGTNVNIRNNATAALYNYTPYQPNAATLANLYGVGDPTCGAHGNRNFWVFYYTWFGNPTGIAPAGVTVSRLEGQTRYETAVNTSKARGTTSSDTVYVASGTNFPDGLSAAPAATHFDAPLLLVEPGAVPDSVVAELLRLRPKKIVVVGGESAVSAGVFAQLTAYASESIRRDGGFDRYETSRQIALNAFSGGATTAYLATGLGFADALTASAAAGHRDAPVLLVDGRAEQVDEATALTLSTLGVTTVYVAGSTGVVSEALVNSVRAIPGMTVTRLGGADRFETASLINRNAFPSTAKVYVAVYNNFPDALAGAALAGAEGSALLLSPGHCIMRRTVQDIIDFKASKVVLIGSSSALTSSVAAFQNCD